MTDNTNIYIEYVSYYIKNLGQSISNDQWKDILKENLGSKKTAKSYKELALKLYYAHFIGLSLKTDVDDLVISDKTWEQLRNILVASNEFRDKYGLPELPIIHYTTDTKATKHMKKFQAPESIIDDILNPPSKVAAPAKKTTKTQPKAKKTKETKPQNNSKAIISKKQKSAVVTKTNAPKIPTFLVVKQGRKTVTLYDRNEIIKHLHGSTKSPVKSKETKSSLNKSLESKTLVELKRLAKDKNIEGRSKMNKDELIRALKLK